MIKKSQTLVNVVCERPLTRLIFVDFRFVPYEVRILLITKGYFFDGKKSVVHYCNKIIIRSEGGTKKLPPGRRSNNNGGVVPSVSLYLHKI